MSYVAYRFNIPMVDARRMECIGEYMVRTMYRSKDFLFARISICQTASAQVRTIDAMRVGQGASFPKRHLQSDGCGQKLVLDFDQFNRGGGYERIVRCDGGDPVAYISHRIVEDILGSGHVKVACVEIKAGSTVVYDMGRVEEMCHGTNSGKSLGSARINSLYTCMSMRGKKHLGMKHAGQVHIVDVLNLSRRLHFGLSIGEPLAYPIEAAF